MGSEGGTFGVEREAGTLGVEKINGTLDPVEWHIGKVEDTLGVEKDCTLDPGDAVGLERMMVPLI